MPGRNRPGRYGRGSGIGRGQMEAGYPKNCICPNCKTKVPHQPGVPCSTLVCPKCGTLMVRE